MKRFISAAWTLSTRSEKGVHKRTTNSPKRACNSARYYCRIFFNYANNWYIVRQIYKKEYSKRLRGDIISKLTNIVYQGRVTIVNNIIAFIVFIYFFIFFLLVFLFSIFFCLSLVFSGLFSSYLFPPFISMIQIAAVNGVIGLHQLFILMLSIVLSERCFAAARRIHLYFITWLYHMIFNNVYAPWNEVTYHLALLIIYFLKQYIYSYKLIQNSENKIFSQFTLQSVNT
jgi:uncharacterized membrane protein